MTDDELRLKSIRYRRDLLRIIFQAGAGHTGGSLSCIDILNVLYNRALRVTPHTFSDPNRDRYIQSKGHSVEALYVVLADRGFFAAAELETLCRYQSPFVGHPTRKVPGIEMNTGALGHGLSISVGLALAAKRDGADYRVFTLLGDGELAEGSNWEAAMTAAHYRLDNLTAILDHNTLQITGRTRDVCSNEPIDEKFRAFGWNVCTVDGHDIQQLTNALAPRSRVSPRRDSESRRDSPTWVDSQPTCVIANTIKGRGVSFMENSVKWHHGVPSEVELQQALAELDDAESALMEAVR
jgi:transketolase